MWCDVVLVYVILPQCFFSVSNLRSSSTVSMAQLSTLGLWLSIGLRHLVMNVIQVVISMVATSEGRVY